MCRRVFGRLLDISFWVCEVGEVMPQAGTPRSRGEETRSKAAESMERRGARIDTSLSFDLESDILPCMPTRSALKM